MVRLATPAGVPAAARKNTFTNHKFGGAHVSFAPQIRGRNLGYLGATVRKNPGRQPLWKPGARGRRGGRAVAPVHTPAKTPSGPSLNRGVSAPRPSSPQYPRPP